MSLAQVRAELERGGLDAARQPDDSTIKILLEVEGGDVRATVRAISAAHAAEEDHGVRADVGSFGAAGGQPLRTSAEREAHDSRDESDPLVSRRDRASAPRPTAPGGWLQVLWRCVSVPLSLVQTLVLACLRAFGLASPLPRSGASGTFEMTRFAQDPRECARRFIKDLERDTGGTTLPSARHDGDMRVALPSFVPGSYSDALQQAKREIKVLVVLLLSRAHGDDALFRSRVLTDRTLLDVLKQDDFVVWGGYVQDREPHRVAMLLEAGTYPFIAFIALQPHRTRHSSTPTPRSAVLSRLEGSPQSSMSAASIVSHISEVVLPRTQPYLNRLRAERGQRELERSLRAEQDRAYAEASRLDMERVKQRRAERADLERAERDRAEEAARHSAAAAKADAWRSWARKHLVPPEPAPAENDIRVAIHLPDGRNLLRRFAPDTRVEQLYAFIDTVDAHDDVDPRPPADYLHQYAYQLVLTYPRQVLDTHALSKRLADIDGLGRSAKIVVEGSWNGDVHSSDSSDVDM